MLVKGDGQRTGKTKSVFDASRCSPTSQAARRETFLVLEEDAVAERGRRTCEDLSE